MSGQGIRKSTYNDSIEKLKQEIGIYAVSIKTSLVWPKLEKAYRSLVALEDLAGVKKTSLEELLAASTANVAPDAASSSELALGDQQESEVAAEIEKGS